MRSAGATIAVTSLVSQLVVLAFWVGARDHGIASDAVAFKMLLDAAAELGVPPGRRSIATTTAGAGVDGALLQPAGLRRTVRAPRGAGPLYRRSGFAARRGEDGALAHTGGAPPIAGTRDAVLAISKGS
jgi:hypothetical protein